jgi:hypothetical protein
MHIRVVRFTDVSQERLDAIKARIAEADGPPEGVTGLGMKIVHDESQNTAVVIQMFENEENMRKSAQALEQMDSADTPGTRASVDAGEVIIEVDG